MPGNLFFVAHSFTDAQRDDLRGAIQKSFSKRSGLRAVYADSEVGQRHILTKIVDMIRTNQFGIYDITGGNPNVCLELGVAMALGKPFYIILRSGHDAITNLKSLDRIEYTSYVHLTEELKKKVAAIEAERSAPTSVSTEHLLKPPDLIVPDTVSEEDILAKSYVVYPAEQLRHRIGTEVEDKDASNGSAWHANRFHNEGHLMFGPYKKLPKEGVYVAFFRIKVESNSSPEPLMLLDVTDVKGGSTASMLLQGNSFRASNKYQLFALPFRYQLMEDMEYRIYSQPEWLKQGNVWVDYVAVAELSRLRVEG